MQPETVDIRMLKLMSGQGSGAGHMVKNVVNIWLEW